MLHSSTPRILATAIGLAVGLVLSQGGPVWGQERSDDHNRLQLDASLDVSSRYLFRGHEKDERGTVLQPEIALAYALYEAPTGTVRELSAGALIWSSVHAGTAAYPSSLGVFEVDLGLSLDATLSNGWNAGLVYTSYLAPTDVFDEIHEIGVALGFGTFGRDGVLTFSPRVLLAQEIHDSGGPEDTYLEAGGELTLPSTGPVRWTVPVVVGMSVDGFYRDANGSNDWFGFLGTGATWAADLHDLGLGWFPGTLTAAVDLVFVNRDAELTRMPDNDLLWTTRVGLVIGL